MLSQLEKEKNPCKLKFYLRIFEGIRTGHLELFFICLFFQMDTEIGSQHDDFNSESAHWQNLIKDDFFELSPHVMYAAALESHGKQSEAEQECELIVQTFIPDHSWWMKWIDRGSNSEERLRRAGIAKDSIPNVAFTVKYFKCCIEAKGPIDSIEKLNQICHVYRTCMDLVKYFIADSQGLWNTFCGWISGFLDHGSFVNGGEQIIDKSDSISCQSHIETAQLLKECYLERLHIPHVQLEVTFNDYSQFVSKYFGDLYEQELVAANKIKSHTLKAVQYREPWEQLILEQPSLQNFAEYIYWESQRPLKYSGVHFVCALYERTLVLNPHESAVWDDYIYYILKNNSIENIWRVVCRAVRACPKAGLLLAHKLRLAIILGKDFGFLQKINEHALHTISPSMSYHDYKAFSLLWFKYLTTTARATEDSTKILDYCDLIYNNARNFGTDDGFFELEKVIIEFYTKNFLLERAELVWKGLSKYHGKSSYFWLQWFDWAKANLDYESAKKVLSAAASKLDIDFPEKIYQSFLLFTLNDGSMQDYQDALIKCRSKATEVFHYKRKEETKVQQNNINNLPPMTVKEQQKRVRYSETDKPSRRKRAKDSEDTKENNSRIYTNLNLQQDQSESKNNKRDREHFTIIVSGINSSTSNERLMDYFSSCGKILSLNIRESNNGLKIALIEFNSKKNVDSALLLDSANLDGCFITVKSAENTTLWVNNFGSNISKKEVELEFSKFGVIISTRFPSLDVKSSRRFCYVQFSNLESAILARDNLNGTAILGSESLEVKISRPELAHKKEITEPPIHGREIIVRQIDFSKDESDLRSIFEPFGEIEKVSLVKDKTGKNSHRGFGFIIFKSTDGAKKSLKMNEVKFGKLELQVEITSPKRLNPKVVSGTPLKSESSSLVKISGLPPCDKQEILDLISVYGPIQDLTINGSEVIVHFKTQQSAGSAFLGLQNFLFKGSILTIKTIGGAQKPTATSMFIPRQTRKKN